MASLRLRNPHSVLAVLDRRPQDVFEIQCPDQDLSDGWRSVRSAAEDLGIPINPDGGDRPGRRDRGKQRRHAGAEAVIKERNSDTLDALIASPPDNGIWIGLDTVQDPHNVGSIFGISGIITTQDRNAPISYTVYDVASGGVEYVPFTIETNLSRTIDRVKEAGIWVLGTSEHSEKNIIEIKRDRPWLVILGNEEDGLRRLTADKCDELVSIPRSGDVGSLNVSVAAGITLSHLISS